MTTKTKPESENLPATAAAKPLTTFEREMAEFTPNFQAALPIHISLERFKRVIITAVNSNLDLANADRRSLFTACVMAAQDGLLPDGREAALVIFSTKIKRKGKTQDRWEDRVQYMPMIAGIRLRMRNSGEVKSAVAEVIHENDEFDHEKGDNPHITHKPILDNPGKPIGAYAIIKLTNGEVLREVMSLADIDKVKAVSKAGDRGPWGTWWTEMARKTVLRRCSKAAPMQADLEPLFQRDDDLEPNAGPRNITPARPQLADFSGPETAGAAEADTTESSGPDTAEFSAALQDTDGVEFDFNDPEGYADSFCKMLEAAAANGADALADAWDVNSPQLHKLREIGREDLADRCHDDFVRLSRRATKTEAKPPATETPDLIPPVKLIPARDQSGVKWHQWAAEVPPIVTGKPGAWVVEWCEVNRIYLDAYNEDVPNNKLENFLAVKMDAPELGLGEENTVLGAG